MKTSEELKILRDEYEKLVKKVTYSHHLTSFASLKWVLLAQELY